MRRICIAGINTLVGKTLISAMLCERLGATYWKPIFTGIDDTPRDSARVASLVTNPAAKILPEPYAFRASLSPHIAAALEGVTINVSALKVPEVTTQTLVIETPGGFLSPLSNSATNADLIQHCGGEVVLVSRHYLGSINHTLLTIEAIRRRNLKLLGVIFSGDELPDTENIITRLGDVEVIGSIAELPHVTADTIKMASNSIQWPYE